VRWHKSAWRCGKAFDAEGQRVPEAERQAKRLTRSREKRKEKKSSISCEKRKEKKSSISRT
jgi:hypothetical protein